MSLTSAVKAINKSLYMLSALLILLVTLMIVLDVFGRGLFDAPLTGTVETVSNIIVVIAFLQLSYSIQTDGMFNTNMLLDKLPSAGRSTLRVAGELTGAAVFACMVYASWVPMMHAWKVGEYYGGGDFRFPVYPVRSIIIFCCVLACINYLLRALAIMNGRRDEIPTDSQPEL